MKRLQFLTLPRIHNRLLEVLTENRGKVEEIALFATKQKKMVVMGVAQAVLQEVHIYIVQRPLGL
jgi:TusA-related sulfurtransferase